VSFQKRVDALKNRGFVVLNPEGEFASQRMIQLESLADRAAELRVKILELPPQWSDQRDIFLDKLKNPDNVNSVDLEFRKFLRQNRPWILVAEKCRVKWSDEGRSVELQRLMSRLDLIDDVLLLSAPRITELIENVAPWRKIGPVLDELDLRLEKRMGAIDGMISMLENRGWDVTKLQSGALHDRFSRANFLHKMDSLLVLIQRQIEVDIRPFDHSLAEKFWHAAGLAQHDVNEGRLLDLKNEIDRVSTSLSERLLKVEGRIAQWGLEGFKINASIPLLPGELLKWEMELPEISNKIEKIMAIWSLIDVQLIQWPEYRQLAERTKGHLNAIESLDVLRQGLESKTEGAISECHSRLAVWTQYGIDISAWIGLVEKEPRGILEELIIHQKIIDLVLPLIEKLESLDTSVQGSNEVQNWLDVLRGSQVGVEDIGGATTWYKIAAERVRLHREYLDKARDDLGGLWLSEINSEEVNLAKYEALVLEFGSGYDAAQLLDKVTRSFEDELDSWSDEGWIVDGLRVLLASDPVQLGLDLPLIRKAMEGQSARVEKFKRLPWNRDSDLAERVLFDLQRPEALIGLDEDLHHIVHRLASLPEGDGGGFEPFVPTPARAVLKRRLPILIPKIENVLPKRRPVAKVVEERFGGRENESETRSKFLTKKEIEGVLPNFKDDEGYNHNGEDFEENVVTDIEVSSDVPELDNERFSQMFGIEDFISVLSYYQEKPLDIRVQRLLRISSIVARSEKIVQDVLFPRLEGISKVLHKWIIERLTNRHLSSGQGMLKDAFELAKKLAETPSLGAPIPMEKDVFPLPSINDLEGLTAVVNKLEMAVRLPSAMVNRSDMIED